MCLSATSVLLLFSSSVLQMLRFPGFLGFIVLLAIASCAITDAGRHSGGTNDQDSVAKASGDDVQQGPTTSTDLGSEDAQQSSNSSVYSDVDSECGSTSSSFSSGVAAVVASAELWFLSLVDLVHLGRTSMFMANFVSPMIMMIAENTSVAREIEELQIAADYAVQTGPVQADEQLNPKVCALRAGIVYMYNKYGIEVPDGGFHCTVTYYIPTLLTFQLVPPFQTSLFIRRIFRVREHVLANILIKRSINFHSGTLACLSHTRFSLL